ncbi:glycosyltransferase family 2 protein [bacterium]|nr:glycosyltransferase family 2 protein [bacterium]
MEIVLILLLFTNLGILALVVWNSLAWPKAGISIENRNETGETCSILIPARNEENNIGACLDAAMAQASPVREIIVCDDHSEDATAALARGYALRDSRIRLIEAMELPEGWCGKPFACATLAAAARCDWLLFIDADTRLATGAAERMMDEAIRKKLSLLSCWPGLVLEGFWEKTLMPMLNFVVFTLFPAPLSLLRPDPSLGLAHGACILIRRADYEKNGGHRLVSDRLFEDTALARAWRAGGRRSLCLDGQDLVRVRMYDSLDGIWTGFQKNFFPAFRKTHGFWMFILLHMVVFWFPFIACLLSAILGWGFRLAAASAACVLAMRAVQAWRFRYPAWSVLLHPLAEGMLLAVGLSSWWRCRSGRGVTWKGRIYCPSRAPGGMKRSPMHE